MHSNHLIKADILFLALSVLIFTDQLENITALHHSQEGGEQLLLPLAALLTDYQTVYCTRAAEELSNSKTIEQEQWSKVSSSIWILPSLSNPS